MRRVVVGGVAVLVDPEDTHLLAGWSWSVVTNSSGQRYLMRRRVVDGLVVRERLHRLVAGAEPGQVVDHINGDTLDNRRCNLRACSQRGNRRNTRHSANQRRGGFKGVSRGGPGRRWQAFIGVPCDTTPRGRRNIYLGSYWSPEDAARAYDAAALRLFGEFAAPNFDEHVELRRVEP